MGRIDLHTHSSFSDGTFTPTEIVSLASERDIGVLSLTDHDTTAGLEEAAAATEDAGIEFVPGVEFSASYLGTSVHVLAYWPDPANEAFAAELARLHDARFRRGEMMVAKLQELGYPITFERVREISKGDNIVRPHIAQALVEAGVVATTADAFTEEFIADGGRADVQKVAIDPIDAVGLIDGAGGVTVLAHPGMWGSQGAIPDELIERMAGAGMVGLEVDHPDHDEQSRMKYRAIAGDLGLAVTGSSDCHGTRYDPVRLGCETTAPDQYAVLKAAAARKLPST